MNSASVVLVVASLAAVGGSLMLYFSHRVRRPRPLDFNEQLRAIAPRGSNRPVEQSSGIVPLEPGPEEER